MRIEFALIITAIFSTGCAYTPREVADPKAITLNAAMVDVANSLNDMRDVTDKRGKLGLLVDEVQVTFNINSKATNTNKLTVGLSNVPVSGGLFAANAENTLQSEGSRGNQIIIKMKNIATADMSKANKQYVTRCYGSDNKPIRCPRDFMIQGVQP